MLIEPTEGITFTSGFAKVGKFGLDEFGLDEYSNESNDNEGGNGKNFHYLLFCCSPESNIITPSRRI